MKKGDVKNKRGFTIIEVTLVLAIAGLIFLMVFVALPALQRGQRDARRRDDILTFLENVKKYQTNNRGGLPADKSAWNNFFTKYLGDNFVDPSGTKYVLDVQNCNSSKGIKCSNLPNLSTMDYKLHVYERAKCEGGDSVVGASNPRTVAVLYRLEGAGVYCANT